MQQDLLNQAHIIESIAGEEDPGASLDMMKAAMEKRAKQLRDPGESARIHFSCSDGKENIAVDVIWPRHYSTDVAKLLGMVMANHGAIADRAWSLFDATGNSSLELEVDEGEDGVFYISSKDC